MKILKSRNFDSHTQLTQFVNDNDIAKEDILNINRSPQYTSECQMFYYGDSEVKEKERNMWGDLKD